MCVNYRSNMEWNKQKETKQAEEQAYGKIWMQQCWNGQRDSQTSNSMEVKVFLKALHKIDSLLQVLGLKIN